jgi:hypothetical protein
VTLWRFRQIDLRNTICIGITLVEKKDQTGLEGMVSETGCTVNVVGEKESNNYKEHEINNFILYGYKLAVTYC